MYMYVCRWCQLDPIDGLSLPVTLSYYRYLFEQEDLNIFEIETKIQNVLRNEALFNQYKCKMLLVPTLHNPRPSKEIRNSFIVQKERANCTQPRCGPSPGTRLTGIERVEL